MSHPSKRRRTNSSAVEEIVFDTSARQEYLTGFHKRKLQRTRYSQELAEKKAREEKIAQRKKLRQERKEELKEHLQAMNAGMVGHETTTEDEDYKVEEDGATGEWSGILDPSSPPISGDVNHEEEYIDEEKYTTVIVEALEVSNEGIYKALKGEDHSSEPTNDKETESANKKDGATKKAWARDKTKSHVAKTKKFRYESKAERKVTRLKEKSGNRKKAKARKSE